MKKKLLTLAPIVLLVAAIGSYFMLMPRTFTGTLDSVQHAKVGELISVTASDASDYKWKILPPTSSFREIEGGKTIIFSASEPGTYLFICAMTKNDKVDLLVHEVVIGNPGPAPKPNSFEALLKSWAPAGCDKAELERVAYSFDMIATSGQTDVSNFIRLTALSNRAALGKDIEKWKPFLQNLSVYCKENLKDKSIDEHIQVWLKISSALRKI